MAVDISEFLKTIELPLRRIYKIWNFPHSEKEVRIDCGVKIVDGVLAVLAWGLGKYFSEIDVTYFSDAGREIYRIETEGVGIEVSRETYFWRGPYEPLKTITIYSKN